MKAVNVRDRRRSTGRLFHARGPATAKARSPMVERSVARTRTSAVDAERSRRRESTSDSWVGLTRTDTVVLLLLDSGALERKVYTGCVQARAASAGSRALWCHMVELARISCESCCSVQHGLNPIKITLRQSIDNGVICVSVLLSSRLITFYHNLGKQIYVTCTH